MKKRFSIVLLIRHPHIDPKKISEELRLEPYGHAKSGEPRMTLQGAPLPGVHERSWWNHIFYYEGDAGFFEEMEQLVNRLALHKDFFHRIANEGGSSELFFEFPGDVNQGNTAKPTLLTQIAELKLNLGLEIFPDSPLDRAEHVGLTKIKRELPRRDN